MYKDITSCTERRLNNHLIENEAVATLIMHINHINHHQVQEIY